MSERVCAPDGDLGGGETEARRSREAMMRQNESASERRREEKSKHQPPTSRGRKMVWLHHDPTL